jgi:hypothetical protein
MEHPLFSNSLLKDELTFFCSGKNVWKMEKNIFLELVTDRNGDYFLNYDYNELEAQVYSWYI